MLLMPCQLCETVETRVGIKQEPLLSRCSVWWQEPSRHRFASLLGAPQEAAPASSEGSQETSMGSLGFGLEEWLKVPWTLEIKRTM